MKDPYETLKSNQEYFEKNHFGVDKMTDKKQDFPWPIINQCADFTKGDWPDVVPLKACCLVPEDQARALYEAAKILLSLDIWLIAPKGESEMLELGRAINLLRKGIGV
jgi:hypothetical protein